jgi:hypothetical protein
MHRVTEAAFLPLRHIAENLRLEDLEEFNAARGEGFDRTKLAEETAWVARQGLGWVAWRNDTGEPVATWGAHRMNAGAVGVWAFGAPGWVRTIRTVTRHIKSTMIPALLKAGYHRAECRALASRADTRIWLTSLGFEQEAVLAEFGVRRENFVLYAWTASRAAPTDHLEEPEQGELPLRLDA